MEKQKNRITRERSYDQMQMSIELLAKCYERLNSTLGCFVHCMQFHPRKYYEEIKKNFDVEIIKLIPRKRSVREKICNSILGYPAMIIVKTPAQILEVFPKIIEQAMGGIYFFNSNNLQEFIAYAREDLEIFHAKIEVDPSHVKFVVDEDSSSTDSVIEILNFGSACNDCFIEALKITCNRKEDDHKE